MANILYTLGTCKCSLSNIISHAVIDCWRGEISPWWPREKTKSQIKILKKNFFNMPYKTKQNTEMSDEEHFDSEFHYPKEQETAEER